MGYSLKFTKIAGTITPFADSFDILVDGVFNKYMRLFFVDNAGEPPYIVTTQTGVEVTMETSLSVSGYANYINQGIAALNLDGSLICESYIDDGEFGSFAIRCLNDSTFINLEAAAGDDFSEGFTLSTSLVEFPAIEAILRSAQSDQNNKIGIQNIGFTAPSGTNFFSLVKDNGILPDLYFYNEQSLLSKYGNVYYYGLIGDGNFLSKYEDIDRAIPSGWILLCGQRDVNFPNPDTLNIHGYIRGSNKTVDKWYIDTVTISADGKTATPVLSKSFTGEVACTFVGSVNNGASYSELPLTGLTPNTDYHLFVKDQFDGVQDIYFTTTADPEIEVRLVDPFFKIENCNALKHYEVNTKKAFFDNAAMKDQLYFNTQMHCYYQPVLTSNIITTQIKSSYRNIIAEVLNVDGQVVQTPAVTLKKQYTEQLDKRDCTFVRSVDGLNTYIYFNGGSVYEPNTLTVKETYTGTSVLPSFCRAGMFIELIGTGILGTYEVLDIIYDNTLQKWCLSIYYSLPVATLAGITQSTYNVNEWNIYEFDLVASALSGVYVIKVTATDTTAEFVPVLWHSEPIRVASSFRKHLEITYTNPENINQIDYTTGIEHLLNVPGRFVDYDPSQDGEDFRSDDNTLVILKRMFNRVIRLTAVGVPQYVAEKLLYASGHNELRVNDYLCKCSEKPEIEIFEKSNLYSVSMSLQLDEGVVITDSTGIVSEAANVLGSETDTVIGV